MSNKAPIGYTCCDIDALVSDIAKVSSSLDQLYDHLEGSIDDERVLEVISDCTTKLNSLYDGKGSLIETIRSANSTLRDWGESLSERVEYLEENIEDLTQQLRDADEIY